MSHRRRNCSKADWIMRREPLSAIIWARHQETSPSGTIEGFRMRRALACIVALLVTGVSGTAQASPVWAGKKADRYRSYADLAAHEKEGRDYRRVQRGPGRAHVAHRRVAHIAIHGGAIEAPTTQLADHAAGGAYAFYSFEGIKASGNGDLHITSTRFDEPRALELVAQSDYTVSWHGAKGSSATTYVGGRDRALARKVAGALRAAGFAVAVTVPAELAGTNPGNIVNRNRRHRGVQLELTRGQRELFFRGGNLSRAWIEDPANRTKAFYRYVAAVDRALS
ncbi:poly-gamma-glutamate hydrolase family protein [Nonomuraea sp. NN258]|uniref:poly-gamma-glutamate hydrolase family protein n=1 Tax=Nonomuraea antri TaxID=2730852 RepID=UPI00156A6A1A|nr:poly-gamma-glutamate hydrolase family protein [Nonomuraea antri]NRQ36517.1 poly-gamma-glutamate hydrolase family protein [Nonomuraea antri]